MNRRNILKAFAAAPLALSAAGAKTPATPDPSLWERFYTRPLLAKDLNELPKEGVFTYTVIRGDTLPGIAAKFYADPKSARAIASWNDLETRAHLHAGQELQLVIPRLALLAAVEVMAKNEGGCTLEAVVPDRRFRKGELFRLRLSANASGWLYAFNRDPDGRWKRLHPTVASESEIVRFTEYVLPNDSVSAAWFQLDRDKGAEEVVCLFAVEAIEELAEILDVPLGDELSEKQENSLDSLLDREEKATKGITRVEGDSAKREAGAIVALGPDSGAPILIYRLKLEREA